MPEERAADESVLFTFREAVKRAVINDENIVMIGSERPHRLTGVSLTTSGLKHIINRIESMNIKAVHRQRKEVLDVE
jgi:hypothetical protein